MHRTRPFPEKTGLTVWGTVHPFAVADQAAVIPTVRHLAAAGFTGVVVPVPPAIYHPDPAAPPRLEAVQSWVTAARDHGLSVILDVGPAFDLGLPQWGNLTNGSRAAAARVRRWREWWATLAERLTPDAVVLRWGDLVPPRERETLRAVWAGIPTWDLDTWTHLDVRDLLWQEWEEDAAWWSRVDALTGEMPVRVRFWWVEERRGHAWPTPEIVHESLGPALAPVLLISLWARGVRHLWWDPVRTGQWWGQDPPEGWPSLLDGGAVLRPWGEPTPTWHALRETLQQAHALALGTLRWEPLDAPKAPGVSWLGRGQGAAGQVVAVRVLRPEEKTLSLADVADIPLTVDIAGPGARLVPLNMTVLEGRGTLRALTLPVVHRAHLGHREVWILNVHQGGEGWLTLDADLVYETGVTLRRDGKQWHVRFEAGQPGQVIWQAGDARLHLMGVDERMAARVWPAPQGTSHPLLLGPSQVLDCQEGDDALVVRVTADAPTALVVVDERPRRLRVAETGKASVWGQRSGMGGVPLGGPKEWGAPRVVLPDLDWTSTPWAGPDVPDGWEEQTVPLDVPLPPGWHWFQTDLLPTWTTVTLSVQGVANVWLGDERLAGIRAPDRVRERALRLPERSNMVPLTVLLWVPPRPQAALSDAGRLRVVDPQGRPLTLWRYRRGLPGLSVQDGRWRWEPHASPRPPSVPALWRHEARVTLNVPETAWVHLGLALGDLGELVWVFVNGVLVGRWWAGWTRVPALWLPPDLCQYRGENTLVLLHWPRGREVDLRSVALVQLGRERISTVYLSS